MNRRTPCCLFIISAVAKNTKHLTVGSCVSSLGFKRWLNAPGKVARKKFCWPPDVFAMSATLLRDSGAYLQPARPHTYPANTVFHVDTWEKFVEGVASEWRLTDTATEDPPKLVVDLLDQVAEMSDLEVFELSRPSGDNLKWLPVLQLLAISDQACRGAGMVIDSKPPINDKNYPNTSLVSAECAKIYVQHCLDAESDPGTFTPFTLCKIVDSTRAIVLPKMRTSQRGTTIRSFSLYLSLISGTDVEPRWHPPRQVLLAGGGRTEPLSYKSDANARDVTDSAGPYNIVLFPWPLEIKPSSFAPQAGGNEILGGRPVPPNAFFTYAPESNMTEFRNRVKALLIEAKKLVGHVHGIVMPEMALSKSDFDSVLLKESLEVDFIVCGVHEQAVSGELGRNYAAVMHKDEDGKWLYIEQEKHHRWALDSAQVNTYGLASVLRPDCIWWEGITLPRRSLNFFGLDAFAAYSVLVCEDLARPDPVADLVRAVGPNLVICLLLDGPQLASRWSARCATVLSDDPGSSIITLSSLGMVKLSRLRDKLHECSRVVALWREPGNSAVELHLDPASDGLLLTLSADLHTESTLDGRSDDGMATALRLAGVYQLCSGV